ncbi:MAG: FAD-binding oxidoreductase [Chloroflexota bacterium]|jgi:hypothetical protein
MTTKNRPAKLNASSASPSTSDLRALFNGRVIASDDPRYESARKVFAGNIDRRPAAIVRVADAGDVSRLVKLAGDYGFELAIRSGGHSGAGHSTTEGGIVLDLSDMKDLQINPDERTAWAQTGLTAAEYTLAANQYGLATGFGDTGSVGLGGITLGGGIGFLVRKYGLTIDSLLAVEVVTADGQLLYVDDESYPDLFWAIRGGGGNFGVATRFKFQLHEVDMIFGGMLFLPATPEIIASFIAEAESAPEELSTIANVMTAPPMPFLPEGVIGKPIIMAMMVYAGNPEEGEKVVAPFRSLATPYADMLRPMHYPEMYPPEEGEYHPVAAARTMFLDRVDHSVAKLILDRLQRSSGSMAVTQLRVLGGAMARVPSQATAFAHRQSRIMANLAALYEKPEEKEVHEEWIAEFFSSLQQSDKGMYVNFVGDEGEASVRAAYPGATWDRLRQVKTKYDPDNLFRLNQNIPPLSGK